MKKYFIAMACLISFGANAEALSQKAGEQTKQEVKACCKSKEAKPKTDAKADKACCKDKNAKPNQSKPARKDTKSKPQVKMEGFTVICEFSVVKTDKDTIK